MGVWAGGRVFAWRVISVTRVTASDPTPLALFGEECDPYLEGSLVNQAHEVRRACVARSQADCSGEHGAGER